MALLKHFMASSGFPSFMQSTPSSKRWEIVGSIAKNVTVKRLELGGRVRSNLPEQQQASSMTIAAKPVIKTSTMDSDLQDEVIQVAQGAIETELNEQLIAGKIKKHFETKYHGMLWHCAVGRNFACFVTHEHSKFLYFYIGQMAVVLFATA